jgi:hypothetical protein
MDDILFESVKRKDKKRFINLDAAAAAPQKANLASATEELIGVTLGSSFTSSANEGS